MRSDQCVWMNPWERVAKKNYSGETILNEDRKH